METKNSTEQPKESNENENEEETPNQPKKKFKDAADAKRTLDVIKNEEDMTRSVSQRLKAMTKWEQAWSAELTRLPSLFQGRGIVENEMESLSSLEEKKINLLMKKYTLVLKCGVYEGEELREGLTVLESICKSDKTQHQFKWVVEQLQFTFLERKEVFLNTLEKVYSRVKESTDASLGRLDSVNKMVEDVKTAIGNLQNVFDQMEFESAGVQNKAILRKLMTIVPNLEEWCKDAIDWEKRLVEKDAAIYISTLRFKQKCCKVINDHEDYIKKQSQKEKDKAKLLDSVLSMVKSFSSNDGAISEEENVGEELKPYVVEFEAIKKSLRSIEGRVEHVKKKVECLKQFSESKGCWTVPLLTTTLAAVFVASVCYNAIRRR